MGRDREVVRRAERPAADLVEAEARQMLAQWHVASGASAEKENARTEAERHYRAGVALDAVAGVDHAGIVALPHAPGEGGLGDHGRGNGTCGDSCALQEVATTWGFGFGQGGLQWL